MPFYDIHHRCTLEQVQRDEIASRITALHCMHFATPSLFVNIRFTQADAKDISTYVGGGRVSQTMFSFAYRQPPEISLSADL